MKNVKFRGKKTDSAAQIPRQKPKFCGPRKTVGPTNGRERNHSTTRHPMDVSLWVTLSPQSNLETSSQQ